jgi:exonuclease SbcD
MRFIHTADWHLGRLFYGVHLTEEQALVMDQLIDIARDARADALVIAGDIYDRAVPPPDAVRLLNDCLSRLILDVKIPTLLIAGNHDSADRLDFGARLFDGRRLHVTGQFRRPCEPVIFHDAHGPVAFHALPYAEPATVRSALQCAAIVDHDSAMRHAIDRIRAAYEAPNADGRSGALDGARSDGPLEGRSSSLADAGSRALGGASVPNSSVVRRSVLIAHAFVAGGAECESERPLSVGGSGVVSADAFAGFNYTALGHLHRPQSLAGGAIRYSGSLMKYSFDEADQAKGIYIVDMAADGSCSVETIPLKPRRDVRRIEGMFDDLMRGVVGGLPDGGSREDYVQADILDPGPILDAMARLRETWPNLLNINRPNRQFTGAGAGAAGARPDVRRTSERTLFNDFFQFTTGEALSPEQNAEFTAVLDRIRREDREEAAETQSRQARETRSDREPRADSEPRADREARPEGGATDRDVSTAPDGAGAAR